jgi:hypothetical protein
MTPGRNRSENVIEAEGQSACLITYIISLLTDKLKKTSVPIYIFLITNVL